MNRTVKVLAASGGAAVLALSVAAAPALADHHDKPVVDKLEFVVAADGIKPFGAEDPALAVALGAVEAPGIAAWSLVEKDEKDEFAEPSAEVD